MPSYLAYRNNTANGSLVFNGLDTCSAEGSFRQNEYAAYLFERGILALLGLLLMLVQVLPCIESSASLTRVGSIRRHQLASYTGIFISTLVTAFSHEVLHSRDFWFVLGLMFAQNKLLKRERGSEQRQLASSVASRSTLVETPAGR